MRKRIGDLFLEKKLITRDQLQQVLAHSKEKGLRFGEAALDLKLVSIQDLVRVLGPSYKVNFFHLEPQYFPVQTKDLLHTDEILKYGALPLGFKSSYGFLKRKKLCNIGLLTPSNQEAADAIDKTVRARLGENHIKSLKIYLVLADQFLEILQEIYGVSEAQIAARDPATLDETLVMFLERGK